MRKRPATTAAVGAPLPAAATTTTSSTTTKVNLLILVGFPA